MSILIKRKEKYMAQISANEYKMLCEKANDMVRKVINGAVGGGGANPHGKILQELRGQLPPPRRDGQHGSDGYIWEER